MKNLTFQLAKPAVEACLRLLYQKHTVRDAASQVGFCLPFESRICSRDTTSRQTNAVFARNTQDHAVITVGKECAHNVKKLLNFVSVVFMREYIDCLCDNFLSFLKAFRQPG